MTKQHSARRGPHGLAWVYRGAGLALLGVGLAGLPAHGGDVPDFLRVVIADRKPASERAVAEQNVLVLDTSMMDIYEGSLAQYKRNMRERVPIILALFSEGGGRMILYRPGHEPLVAEPVPIVYQLTKSVSHSSMAVYQLVAPYLADPSDKSWHGPMQVFRTRCQTALESLDGLNLSADDRAILEAILKRNLAFMDECLKTGTFTTEQAREICPRHARATSARPSGSRRAPRSPTGWRSWPAGRSCSARTGSAPTPPATRFT